MEPGGGVLVGVRPARLGAGPGASAALGRTETVLLPLWWCVLRAATGNLRALGFACSCKAGSAGVQPDWEEGFGGAGPLATTAVSGLLSSPFGAWGT